MLNEPLSKFEMAFQPNKLLIESNTETPLGSKCENYTSGHRFQDLNNPH